MRICFDLDDTILNTDGCYYSATPRYEVIQYMHLLRSRGHVLIINTARKMNTFDGNLGKVMANIAAHTFEQLERFNIPYDEIYFGKPAADAYVDDKAVNALDFTQLKEQLDGLLDH